MAIYSRHWEPSEVAGCGFMQSIQNAILQLYKVDRHEHGASGGGEACDAGAGETSDGQRDARCACCLARQPCRCLMPQLSIKLWLGKSCILFVHFAEAAGARKKVAWAHCEETGGLWLLVQQACRGVRDDRVLRGVRCCFAWLVCVKSWEMHKDIVKPSIRIHVWENRSCAVAVLVGGVHRLLHHVG